MSFDPFVFAPATLRRPRGPLRLHHGLRERVASGYGGLGGSSAQPLCLEDVRQRFGPARTLGAPEAQRLAMDAALGECGAYSLLQHSLGAGGLLGVGASGFLGYAMLSELQQSGLIRAGVDTVADEMTQNGIEITGADTADDDRVKALTREMERLDVQGVFNRAASLTGYFGGCLVYLDTGPLDPVSAVTPLHLDAATFAPGSLRRLTVVEPINIFPGRYNASNPLDPAYFTPDTWWILGREYHKSRFLYFSSCEMPLLLRPSYNFFGLSMAQLAVDYVAHFTESREAAARLLTKFSLTAFKTNLSGVLSGGGTSDLDARMAWFIQNQTNNGCFVLDKEEEDLVKLDTSLAGVVDIVRQALELLAAVFRVPAVKLLGISPAGFNATGEGDLRNFYAHVASQQQKILQKPLARVLDVIQQSLLGRVDQSLGAEFAAPGDNDAKYLAEVAKIQADTDAVLLDRSVISQAEVRARLAANPASGYSSLDVDALPEPAGAGLGPLDDADKAGEVW